MFIKELNDKIGNILIYFAEKHSPLYLTKALKLLYLLDEHSVKESGVPYTWFDYKVWSKGPVPVELYNFAHQIYSEKSISLEEYVNITLTENPVNAELKNSYLVTAKKRFSDDNFSEYDLSLLEIIDKKYGKLNSDELIDILHKEGTLWDREVKSNKLDFKFRLQKNTSNISIDFTDLLVGDSVKQLTYESAFDSLKFYQSLR